MRIVNANASHKRIVLHLLDQFREACMRIIDPKLDFTSNSAQKYGGKLFDIVIGSSDSAVFLARNENDFVGIVTVHKIPQIRKSLI